MPKYARDYDWESYSNSSVTHKSATISTYDVKDYSSLRMHNKSIARKHKKQPSTLMLLGVLSVLTFIACSFLSYSYNKVTKPLLNLSSHKNILVENTLVSQILTPSFHKNSYTNNENMQQMVFPVNNYMTNSWYLDKPLFNYSNVNKKAQMVKPAENENIPPLQQQLNDLMSLYPTVQPSIFVWDYETHDYVDIAASKHYSTASIIKIPILIDVFKSIEAGQFTLNDKIPLTEYYRTEGSGSLQFKARNSEYTIDTLARMMITESDNSATNMLMSKVGSMTDVNQSIRDWGLRDTQVRTWLPDMRGNNYTSARDMATMLYNMDTNPKLLTQESKEKIFDYMSHVHNNRLIQAGLNPNAKFYHKTGDIGTMLGDAGIVVAPNGRKYIVVILAKRQHNAVEGKDFIVKASEIIYNYMVR